MKLGLAIATVGMLAVSAFAADKIESGLAKGAGVPAYDVAVLSGEFKGQQLCLV